MTRRRNPKKSSDNYELGWISTKILILFSCSTSQSLLWPPHCNSTRTRSSACREYYPPENARVKKMFLLCLSTSCNFSCATTRMSFIFPANSPKKYVSTFSCIQLNIVSYLSARHFFSWGYSMKEYFLVLSVENNSRDNLVLFSLLHLLWFIRNSCEFSSFWSDDALWCSGRIKIYQQLNVSLRNSHHILITT